MFLIFKSTSTPTLKLPLVEVTEAVYLVNVPQQTLSVLKFLHSTWRASRLVRSLHRSDSLFLSPHNTQHLPLTCKHFDSLLKCKDELISYTFQVADMYTLWSLESCANLAKTPPLTTAIRFIYKEMMIL